VECQKSFAQKHCITQLCADLGREKVYDHLNFILIAFATVLTGWSKLLGDLKCQMKAYYGWELAGCFRYKASKLYVSLDFCKLM